MSNQRQVVIRSEILDLAQDVDGRSHVFEGDDADAGLAHGPRCCVWLAARTTAVKYRAAARARAVTNRLRFGTRSHASRVRARVCAAAGPYNEPYPDNGRNTTEAWR